MSLAQAPAAQADARPGYGLAAGLPKAAEAVFEAAEAHNVACSWDWFALLQQEVFVGQVPTQVLAVERAGRCVLALPVVGGQTPGALVNYYSAYYAPLTDPAVPAHEAEWLALARQLRAWLPGGVASWRFAPLDPTLPATLAMKQGLRKAGFAVFPYFRFGNWYLPCAGVPWDQYLASRPGPLRTTLQRMPRRFERDGGRLEIIQGLQRCETGLAAYETVYAASWKQAEPYPNFIRGLVHLAARRGWLRLGVAWLGERPVAAQIWIVAHGRAEIFKLAYDEQANRYSAGSLLTAALMQQVLDVDRVHEVDYLMGDDAYKQAWMTHRRERWGLLAVDMHRPAGWWQAAKQWGSQAWSQARAWRAEPAAPVDQRGAA